MPNTGTKLGKGEKNPNGYTEVGHLQLTPIGKKI